MNKKILPCLMLFSCACLQGMHWYQKAWYAFLGEYKTSEELHEQLCRMCAACDAEEVEKLLVMGASVNAGKITPLSRLFLYNYPKKKDTQAFKKALTLLLKYGARECHGQPGLFHALALNDKDMVQFLAEQSAVNMKGSACYPTDKEGRGKLSDVDAAIRFEDPDISLKHMSMKLCKRYHNILWYIGETPLHYAASDEEVCVLLSYGADIHACHDWGHTPLHTLVQHQKDYSLLLEHMKTRGGIGAEIVKLLEYKRQKSEAISCLLGHGASLYAQDNDGKTPLHYMDWVSSKELPEILLYVNSPAGIETEKWHNIQNRLFTTLCCCLQRQLPKDVRRLLQRYVLCAEADGPLCETLSVRQYGWLVKRKLLGEDSVLDLLVKRHFARVGKALSTEDSKGDTPQLALREPHVRSHAIRAALMAKENYGDDYHEAFDKYYTFYKSRGFHPFFDFAFAYLDPSMEQLKRDCTLEIRERYRRVLHGLPQTIMTIQLHTPPPSGTL